MWFQRAPVITGTCLLVASAHQTLAAEIDLNGLLLQKLAASPTIRHVNEANARCPSLRAGPARLPCPIYRIALGNLRLYDSVIRYAQVEPVAVPDSIKKDTYTFPNCTDQERQHREDYKIHYEEGYSVVTRDSIQNTLGASVSLDLGKVLKLGITDSVVVSFAKEETTRHSTTVDQAFPFDERIPPRTLLLVTVERRISNAYLDFRGEAKADADVYVGPAPGWNGETRNIGKVSALLSEAPTITMNGQIWNAKSQGLTKSYRSGALAPDSPQCSLNRPNAIPDVSLLTPDLEALIHASSARSSPAGGARERPVLELARVSPIALTTAGASAAQVTVPFVDGMSISTGDVVGNVEVRAQSLGPGFCGVTFSASGDSTSFLAPPLTWSPWTTLTSNIGRYTFVLNHTVVCDVGVDAQVRYWR